MVTPESAGGNYYTGKLMSYTLVIKSLEWKKQYPSNKVTPVDYNRSYGYVE